MAKSLEFLENEIKNQKENPQNKNI
jgi:hypothetical protein